MSEHGKDKHKHKHTHPKHPHQHHTSYSHHGHNDHAMELLHSLMKKSTLHARHARSQLGVATGMFFRKKGFTRRIFFALITIAISFILIFFGIFFIWIGTLQAPTFDDFTQRKIATSTRIYDKTEKVLLYDVHENIQRTIVTFDNISPYVKNSVIAIEDKDFYKHNGIKFDSTLRAITNTILRKLHLRSGSVQGGSTLTQQVLKNTILTSNRNISRKMKEWFLAVKLEKVLSKDEILTHYLNESPYGGSIYGVETASEIFFGKKANEVTLAEAAYLAAIPNAPSLFSPYGTHVDKLDDRKNLVLRLMREQGYITDEEYTIALTEQVVFRPKKDQYAKAIHFVEYVRAYLEEKYGKDAVENEGLDVITTLDWELQSSAEDIVKEEALKNEETWNASNMGLVAVDPTTGQILSMVGSRDYSDPDIDGKYNIALAKRQPGSSFKPIVYVTGFQKGYTDSTILFDVQTQFTSHCRIDDFIDHDDCYSPKDYDGKFLGPVTIREALGQSRNVPAVKMLYLVGVNDALVTAKSLGINTLLDANQYGLTLVLGGGEVTLLEMTSAFGVFANDGVRLPSTPIIKVTNKKGIVLEEYKSTPVPTLDSEATRVLNDILSDNNARAPLFGVNSFMYFGDRYDVAAKTGTTNNNRDAWLIGYSPSIVVGVWSGNNDNTPMKKGSSISGPAWRKYMDNALPKVRNVRFIPPAFVAKNDTGLKPILRGVWAGGRTVIIDRISEKLATEYTPPETKDELIYPNPHSILHWVNRADPRGPVPDNPASDRQYEQWEYGVRQWIIQNGIASGDRIITDESQIPTSYDDVHTPENMPKVSVSSLSSNTTFHETDPIIIIPDIEHKYPIKNVSIFLNNTLIGSTEHEPFTYSFVPQDTDIYTEPGVYAIKVVVTDAIYNRGEVSTNIQIE